jgi:hypothetical protein
MPVLICEKCNVYYDLDNEFDAKDFGDCECGNELVYFDSLDDYYKAHNEFNKINVKRDSIVKGLTYTEKQVHKYETDKDLGDILTFIGIGISTIGFIWFLALFNFNYLLLTFLGLIIFLCGKSLVSNSYKGWSWFKELEGEKLVSSSLSTLPEDFFVFNDVKLPSKWGNIDHIVVGPNNVFIIETKNYSGQWRIHKNKWYFYKNSRYYEARHNPTTQILKNELDLEKFLLKKDIDTLHISIIPIIALINDNFKIMTDTSGYEVIHLRNLTNFILNYGGISDADLLNKVVLKLKPYCTEFTFTRK